MEQSWADDSSRVLHVVVMTVFSFLALVAVLFRIWARRIQRSRVELNDYLCIVGLVWLSSYLWRWGLALILETTDLRAGVGCVHNTL